MALGGAIPSGVLRTDLSTVNLPINPTTKRRKQETPTLSPSVRVQLTRESLRARDLADYHLSLALVAAEHKRLSYEALHLKDATCWEQHANDLEARLRNDD